MPPNKLHQLQFRYSFGTYRTFTSLRMPTQRMAMRTRDGVCRAILGQHSAQHRSTRSSPSALHDSADHARVRRRSYPHEIGGVIRAWISHYPLEAIHVQEETLFSEIRSSPKDSIMKSRRSRSKWLRNFLARIT